MAVTQAQAREQPAQRPGAEKSLADTGWGWQAGVGRAGSGGSVGHRWCLKLCLSACGEITVAWVPRGSERRRPGYAGRQTLRSGLLAAPWGYAGWAGRLGRPGARGDRAEGFGVLRARRSTACPPRAQLRRERQPPPSPLLSMGFPRQNTGVCNPVDGSPPGSPIPGILQARILEWVTMSSSRCSPPGSSVYGIL